MNTISGLKALPIPERLQLVEDLWDSIALNQESQPDHSQIVQEIRRRRARFDENPGSGIAWSQLKKQIRGYGARDKAD